MKENNINSGIYKITNITNNNSYIGSSSNLKSRKYKHFLSLKNNVHSNNHFQNDYNKSKKEYGEDKIKEHFKWEIIKYIEKYEDKEIFKKELLKWEQYYLDNYLKECLYNIRIKADSNLGYKHSDETKLKISITQKGRKKSEETKEKMSIAKQNMSEETRNKIGRANKVSLRGRIVPDDVKYKISASCKGKKKSEESVKKSLISRKGFKHSEETKQKIREHNLGKKLLEETKKKMSEAKKRN